MSIISRIKMNIKANINYALDKAEDPQKVLDQMLLDMRDSIQEFKGAISEAIVSVKKLEREIAENAEKIKLWEERAILALKNNNDELAKKAIEQKLKCLDYENKTRIDLENQKKTVEELKASLPILEAKLNELYGKRNELIKKSLQIKTLQATESVDRVIELGIDSSVFNTYDSVVDKIMALEDYASALAELSQKDEVDAEFKKLERKSKIESELKNVKESMKNNI